jgi:hypothetical protein
MATPSTREQLKDYCLRQLGFPVIEINVDDDQVEDRIDEALQYYQDYHYDSVQKIYYIKSITQEDIDQKYISMDSANADSQIITAVTRIFPISDTFNTANMFDLRYQLRLNELYDFTSASYVNYTLTQQHLRSLELLFTGSVPIRFARHQKKLFIDWAWGASEAPVGMAVVAECYSIIDPEVYNEVYNDRWLKQYTTALIKRQWGANLKKFGGIQLPGGVTLNGKEIYDEAENEITAMRTEMQDKYELPVEFMMN